RGDERGAPGARPEQQPYTDGPVPARQPRKRLQPGRRVAIDPIARGGVGDGLRSGNHKDGDSSRPAEKGYLCQERPPEPCHVPALPARLIAASVVIASAAPAFAVQCEPPGGFPAFIESFKQEAKAKGIGQRGVSALNGLKLDTATIAFDRKVRSSFKGSFEQF